MRRFRPAFAERFGLTSRQERILRSIERCRTRALGATVLQCPACGVVEVAYHSCRDRHCPKCGGGERAAWLAKQAADLLPVEYFHVVFTLPAALRPLAAANRFRVYNLLLRTAAETLQGVAERRLGGRLGVLEVLHTWTQRLDFHPHVHCIAPGGALTAAGTWNACPAGYFLPVQVLSRLFRGKFLAGLRELHAAGRLHLKGPLQWLQPPSSFSSFCRPLYRMDWVVYAKRPFGGPEQVLKYLAAYTHRVAVSDRRIVEAGDKEVTFEWKDRSDDSKAKRATLEGVEFLRRFLQHECPRRFVRIRRYGWLANSGRSEALKLIRAQLAASADETSDLSASDASAALPATRCPRCGEPMASAPEEEQDHWYRLAHPPRIEPPDTS